MKSSFAIGLMVGSVTVAVLQAVFLVLVTLSQAQSCMQMGQMYQCSDGTQGMNLGGGLGAFSNPRSGTQGQTMDLGGGLSTFSDNTGRSGTQFDQRGIGQWQDNRGNAGTYQDVGPAFRNFQPSTPYQPRR